MVRGGDLQEKCKHLPDLIICGPKIWSSVSRKQLNERRSNKRGTGKPKLDDARKLRGNCFIVPEDKEFKETIKTH